MTLELTTALVRLLDALTRLSQCAEQALAENLKKPNSPSVSTQTMAERKARFK